MSADRASAWLRRRYGRGPLHLLAAIASFALVTYVFLEIADQPSAGGILIWFAGAIVLHDLIAFPLYSLLGLIAGRLDRPARGTINWVRIPALLSAFAFVVWFPFILGLSDRTYELASGRSTDPFLSRWLLLTAGLFAGSGLAYAVRARMRNRHVES